MDLSHFKILVVDDHAITRNLLRKSLSNLGVLTIVEASNGKEALQRLEKEAVNQSPFSIIFSDWQMPEMNGYEFLLAIRQRASYRDIPFIMVSAERDPAEIIKAIRSGANEFIVKPFSEEVLRQKIGYLIKTKQVA